jgi:hypothetical protein
MNMTYATCETNPDNTVIVIENGEETRIDQLSNNCYHISSKDCDILKALEKFELQVLEDYVKSLG